MLCSKYCFKTFLFSIQGVLSLQRLIVCELRDDGEPGQMITRDAVRGSTTDELLYVDNNFTYQGRLNVSTYLLKTHLEVGKIKHEHLYRPYCIKTLKRYIERRRKQVSRKGTMTPKPIKRKQFSFTLSFLNYI